MTDTAAQSQEQLERTALISNNIRQALRRALPAPVEQFFTVSVPGKVVNFEVRVTLSYSLITYFLAHNTLFAVAVH